MLRCYFVLRYFEVCLSLLLLLLLRILVVRRPDILGHSNQQRGHTSKRDQIRRWYPQQSPNDFTRLHVILAASPTTSTTNVLRITLPTTKLANKRFLDIRQCWIESFERPCSRKNCPRASIKHFPWVLLLVSR